ncbi:MAG: LptF/LptG family permease [Prevotella sp.]|nr:LptF/LptG family permease [Prevotella sp.]
MFRIKKLDIFVAKQFGLLFVGTFFICQFVLMMQFLWRYVDELIGKGLSLDVLAQFFWYMGLMLMPQALPLAILLSSLITFGNLGESSELTAIKAAGISLMQSFRSLIVIVLMITGLSLFFQDVVGPLANQKFFTLLRAMKQASPELEIPEGIFYDGIPGSNIYVQKKDLNTGKLYGIMIYQQRGSYEDQAIILADSGMMQSTAEKMHLLLTLWSGEWFENMNSQDIGGSAQVPYRRETFAHKEILLDFDNSLNMDMTGITASAQAKGIRQLTHDADSIDRQIDSLGHAYYADMQHSTYYLPPLASDDSLKLARAVETGVSVDLDSAFASMSGEERLNAVKQAVASAQQSVAEIGARSEWSRYINRQARLHKIEVIGKFTLALSCIIFFFIGAPLGAIIRKGGLGVPVIISVLVFIVYYIFDNTGMRMAREDEWAVWFGKLIATMVLAPLAVFFTYKANSDSTVFNIDAYRLFFIRVLGLRQKRNIQRKEVIIEDPVYPADSYYLLHIIEDVRQYSAEHHLHRPPNPVKVFFRPGDDHTIERIAQELEEVITDLSNSKDAQVINLLNSFPVMATHAHTRPFRSKWLNAVTALVVPVGLFFYLRMWRFRRRLSGDLKKVTETSQHLLNRIATIAPPAPVSMEQLEQMTFIADLVAEVEKKKQKQQDYTSL